MIWIDENMLTNWIVQARTEGHYAVALAILESNERLATCLNDICDAIDDATKAQKAIHKKPAAKPAKRRTSRK